MDRRSFIKNTGISSVLASDPVTSTAQSGQRPVGQDARADGRRGDPDATSRFTQLGRGAQRRDPLAKMREAVSILDFIPEDHHGPISSGTSTFDCHDALMDAIASYTNGSGFAIAGPAIYFPPGYYHFGKTIHLKKQVKLYGTVAGMPDGRPCRLLFPLNTGGIVVQRYNTDESGIQSQPTAGGDGSVIENLTLVGSGGKSSSAHGIYLRARATIRNVTIDGFAGDGIRVKATAGARGMDEGNANNFRVDTCRILQNGGSGIYVKGADANAGLVVGVDCTSNQGFGIHDSSFLGNTYIACHTDNNKLGAYRTDGVGARNMLLGCYSEGGQPPSFMEYPTIVQGGLHGAGLTGRFVNNLEYPTRTRGTAKASTGEQLTASFGAVDAQDGNVWQLHSSDEGEGAALRMHYQKGRWYMNWANTAFHFLMIYNQQASTSNGYARNNANGRIGMPSYYLGDHTQMRYRGVGAAPPSSGSWIQGDIVYNTAPLAGGYVGWICTAGGSPGTWKTFGAIS